MLQSGYICSQKLFILSFSESVKQEPQDDAFTAKKKGVKRKRIKDDPKEGTSDSANSPT